MGIIIHTEYVCDRCGQVIEDEGGFVGKLMVRRQGQRGIGKSFELALHETCADIITRHAVPSGQPRRHAMVE